MRMQILNKNDQWLVRGRTAIGRIKIIRNPSESPRRNELKLRKVGRSYEDFRGGGRRLQNPSRGPDQ